MPSYILLFITYSYYDYICHFNIFSYLHRIYIFLYIYLFLKKKLLPLNARWLLCFSLINVCKKQNLLNKNSLNQNNFVQKNIQNFRMCVRVCAEFFFVYVVPFQNSIYVKKKQIQKQKIYKNKKTPKHTRRLEL